MSATRPRPRLIWWARPHWVCAWLMTPIVLLAYANSEVLARQRDVHSFLDLPALLALLGSIALIAFGSVTGSRLRLPAGAPRQFPPWLLDALFWTSAVAFVIWFHALLANPALFVATLLGVEGSIYSIREDYGTIPGVTTLVQCSLAYACILAYQYPRLRGIRRRHRLYLAGIIVMAMFRTLAWSERLCLIEIVVTLSLAYTRTDPAHRFGRLYRAAPLAAFGALYTLFSITEYFRSWTASYKDRYDSLFEFITLRISEYYYFAINNGLALLREETSWYPHYSMLWLEKLPGIGKWLVESFHIDTVRGSYLEAAGLLELNNFGGLLGLVVDYGVIGGAFAILLLGFVAGIACRRFAARRGYLGLVFPLLFMTLLDLPRLFYLGDPRAFVPLAVLGLCWLGFARPVRPVPAGLAVQPAADAPPAAATTSA